MRERYLNPYTDFGFKKLFGTQINKELLISFLNALLHGEQTICDITYLNSEYLGVLEPDRRAIFDVYCENDKGEKFIVEMQKAEQKFFKDRSVFYSTFPIREQAQRGSWSYELKAVYTVGILNFVFDEDEDDEEFYHHEVKLMEVDRKKIFYDKLTFIYLEMPEFNKTEEELVTMFDKWMYVLKNLSSLMERPRALQERIFERVFRVAEIAHFNKKELDDYEESLKIYRDWYSVTKTAEEKGMQKGIQEGIQKGMQEGIQKGIQKGMQEGLKEGLEKGIKEGMKKGMQAGKEEIARNALRQGLPITVIIELTGLTADEINGLDV